MNAAFRNFALTLAAFVALSACTKDSRSAEDVLAEDSTLALEVMAANADTLSLTADTAIPNTELTDAAPVQDQAPVQPVLPPAAIVQASPSPAVTTNRVAKRSSSARRTSVSRTRTPRNVERPRSRSAATTSRSITLAKSTPMTGSATLPAGTELSLTSGQRVCASMSNPGDRFTVRFARDVVGPIGVVIPKGTAATAQIFSLEKSVDLRMQSITFDGHAYSVDSDVTYTEIEKVTKKRRANTGRVAAGAGIGAVTGGVIGGSVPGAVIGAAGGALAGAMTSRRSSQTDHCIPDGGQISVRLTEPLKLALSE